MILRDYQQAALDALYAYWEKNDGNPILVLPTGSGKSVIQAEFVRKVLESYPAERLLLLTHVKELIEQNASKIPGASIYSAGLGKKEWGQVTVAGIQSVYKKAHKAGDVGIVIIDEAHLVSKTSNTMYRRFLDDLKSICPKVKILGLSATPYRLDSGPLHKGDNRIFTDIAYEITIRELIDQGYLAPLVTAKTSHKIDTSGVKKRGGEYVTGDLEQAMLGTTEDALRDAHSLARDRKSWLVFCVSIEHAKEAMDVLRKRAKRAGLILGETPPAQRALAIEEFKRGRYDALVSVGVLTTGFDAPCADALICLRPTLSPGLWVQMVGRVSRIWAGKENGLILDYTNNSYTHGPVDLISVDGDGNVKTCPWRICQECGELYDPHEKECPKCGAKWLKTCPECQFAVDRDAKTCLECGHEFGRKRKAEPNQKAFDGDVVSKDGWRTVEVESWQFWEHRKEGKPPSVRVEYYCTNRKQPYCEWLCFEHGGYVAQKARTRWWKLGGWRIPMSTSDALKMVNDLTMLKTIKVKKDGGYWVVGQGS